MGDTLPVYKKAKVAELIPYARNSRTHSDAQVAKIASSIREFGFLNPVIVDGENGIIAGHGRVMAAQLLGLETVPAIEAAHLTDAQRRAYIIADNRLALDAGWDEDMLRVELGELQSEGFDLGLTGFELGEIEGFLADPEPEPQTDGNAIPPMDAKVVSQAGDVWILGQHRVMCGDSTSLEDVEKLMAGASGQLLHADPPYGMGKQADGVENDNLYREKLDAFQMAWWQAFRPYLDANASAYIWGNAPDLWRLWYVGGLGASERLEMRNEIVWDKASIAGMASPDLTQFPIASERCLFFQFGDQFLGNINADDFPETWEPVRAGLAAEAEAAGVGPAEVKRVCNCGMFGHWFSKSQFTLIPEKHYQALAEAFPGHFEKPWREWKAEWDRVKGAGRAVINGKLDGVRSYFDNAHDTMRDTWTFPRVTGDDRFGHATPKPVAMMERAIMSACPKGGVVAEPFGGTGATLIAAQSTSRRCFTMELQGRYVDVIVRRWQNFTGQDARLEATDESFSEVEAKQEER